MINPVHHTSTPLSPEPRRAIILVHRFRRDDVSKPVPGTATVGTMNVMLFCDREAIMLKEIFRRSDVLRISSSEE